MKKQKSILVISIVLIISVILNFILFFPHLPQKTSDKENLVINVLDGDTIVINKGVLVRLHGINAPALEFCGGQEAKQELEKLVLNKNISIREIAKGEYDRILGLVYVNNLLVNEILLKQGHAELFGAKTSQKAKLQAANQYARKNKKGIYGKCILNQPADPACTIKANIHARNKTKIYHLPNCPSYKTTIIETFRGENWFCSETEAQKAGFKKAKNCP